MQKTLAIVNSELELLTFKITHPESFPSATPPTFESPLSVIPKFQYLGIMGMTEILSALMLLGGIADSTGKKPSIIAFSDVYLNRLLVLVLTASMTVKENYTSVNRTTLQKRLML